jgi:hypothetical protein
MLFEANQFQLTFRQTAVARHLIKTSFLVSTNEPACPPEIDSTRYACIPLYAKRAHAHVFVHERRHKLTNYGCTVKSRVATVLFVATRIPVARKLPVCGNEKLESMMCP